MSGAPDPMPDGDMTGLLAILAMGFATYATRIGGFWLIRRLKPSPLLEAWLGQIPGAVFAALCAPMVLHAGPVGWAGAAITAAVARTTGNFLVAMTAGVGLVAVARNVL